MDEARSKKFDEVKNYYDNGEWPKKRVKNAVKAKWITSEEYELIVGEAYD